jgi:uncharacterized protein (DUF1015 family)
MAQIAPLTPLRYDTDRILGGLASVVAPPYDVISPEERAALAARDPHNVVRLILPEGEGEAKYAHAADLLERWRAEGVLVRDPQPAFYRYDQAFASPLAGDRGKVLSRRGFLALVRVAPFSDRVVLPHERTLSGPKEDRLKLFRATRTNLSPGFMLYSDPRRVLDGSLENATTIADFVTADGVRHSLSKVSASDSVRAIVQGLSGSSLLIADGHHRYETALRYSGEVDAGLSPREPSGLAPSRRLGEHNYFMVFLANGDDPDLVVFPTHRHVHSLASFSFGDLVERSREYFDVFELGRDADAEAIIGPLREAGRRGSALAAAAPDGRAVVLTLKPGGAERHTLLANKPHPLRHTDVVVLHSAVLEHVLGITPEAQMAKTNLWYPQDASQALQDLRGGRGQVLFLMNPTAVRQVRAVAEAGEVMPQKSTFFYPKVLTGLAIHTLDPAREVAG